MPTVLHRSRFRLAIAATLALCAAGPALAAGNPAPPAKGPPAGAFHLDEYFVTAARTSNSFQLGAGLQFGWSIGPRYWWFVGGRLGWVQGEAPGDVSNAASLGVVGGFGFRPEKRISPIARIGIDKWLGSTDVFESQRAVSAGARFRVSPGLVRHYAISFEAYRSNLKGASGVSDRSDFGLLVAYSVAFYQKR